MLNKRFSDFFISRNFSFLWLGQALSSFGEFVFESTVIVWWVTDLFHNSAFLPTAVGLAVAASAIPRVLVAPLAIASLAGTLVCSQTLNLAQHVIGYFDMPFDVYGVYIFLAAGLLLTGAGLMLVGQRASKGHWARRAKNHIKKRPEGRFCLRQWLSHRGRLHALSDP